MRLVSLVLVFIFIAFSSFLATLPPYNSYNHGDIVQQIQTGDFDSRERKNTLLANNLLLNHIVQDNQKISGHQGYSRINLSSLSVRPTDFVTRWDTNITNSQSTPSNQIRLPLQASGSYNFTVNWGDGTNSFITQHNQPEVTHTFPNSGEYTVIISGRIKGWQFLAPSDTQKLIELAQWGTLNLGNSGSYFYGSINMVLTATDPLDLNGRTNFYRAFLGCVNIGSSGNMNKWNVSAVTDMSLMFYGANSFNSPLNEWMVSSVTNMKNMFFSADSFSQPINNWNVSSVTNMQGMFSNAYSFDQPLDDWNVSHVMTMAYMFDSCMT